MTLKEGANDALMTQITNEFYRRVNAGADDRKIMFLVAAMAILSLKGSDSRAVVAARKLFQKGM